MKRKEDGDGEKCACQPTTYVVPTNLCAVSTSHWHKHIQKGNINTAASGKPKIIGIVCVYCTVQYVFYVEVRRALFLHRNLEGSDDMLKPAGDCGGIGWLLIGYSRETKASLSFSQALFHLARFPCQPPSDSLSSPLPTSPPSSLSSSLSLSLPPVSTLRKKAISSSQE